MRVAASVHLFVVVQAHIQLDLAYAGAVFQHLEAGSGVVAHGGELFVRQLARLVEDLQGDRHLAHVVQQSGQARLPRLDIVQTQFPGQGHHQAAHRYRVHVGVVVLGLQPGQADQRARVAHHRGGDLLHQRRAGLGVDRLAHAGLLEHGGHRLLGFGANACRSLHLGRHLRPLHPYRSGLGYHRQVLFHCGIGVGLAHTSGHVQAFGSIDPDLADAAVHDAADVLRVIQLEGAAPEGMFHPGPAEFLKEHPGLEIFDIDSFEHGENCVSRFPM